MLAPSAELPAYLPKASTCAKGAQAPVPRPQLRDGALDAAAALGEAQATPLTEQASRPVLWLVAGRHIERLGGAMR